LERGDKDELFIPLTGQTPNEPFLIELRYNVPGDHRNLELPEFLEDPAVQQIFLAAYLPQDWMMLGSSGPWTEESSRYPPVVSSSMASSIASPAGDVHALFATLARGVSERIGGGNLVVDLVNGFPTDGTMYLFSALRPEGRPNGNLHLVAYQQSWVHGIVLATIALLGLLLIGRPISTRIASAGFLLIAAVLAAVFAPTFVQQIADQAFFAAITLVLLVWLVEFMLKVIVRRPRRTKNEIPLPTEASITSEEKTSGAATESTESEQGGSSHG
jgi:uncharacterized membrane protein